MQAAAKSAPRYKALIFPLSSAILAAFILP
jgi:hypothetical protein